MTNTTCTHESRTQSADLAHWECDDCGDLTPLTAKDRDWQPWNHMHCVLCGHSTAFGGALVWRFPAWGQPYAVHHTPCA